MGGCEIKKDGQRRFDGESPQVLRRDPERDAEENWSVTVRPYRPRPADRLLADVSSDTGGACGSCLLAGNRVLMSDGSLKSIETILAGDMVQTMSGPSAVRHIEPTLLGMTRKVIELRGQGDECLIMSDDHPLWVSRPAADGTVSEWWGTYNLNHVLYEMRTRTGYELDNLPAALNFDLPEQVAHVGGWLHLRPIYHHLPPSTPLFHLVVDTGFSFIAEGFPLFSRSSIAQKPSSPWRGLQPDAAAARFVKQVALAA